MTSDLAARLRQWRDLLCDWLDERSQRLRQRAEVERMRTLAVQARHPYADDIAKAKAKRNIKMLNNTVIGGSFLIDGHTIPIPDGEFGPQCDLPEGVCSITQDERWVYADDGERYPIRQPRRSHAR